VGGEGTFHVTFVFEYNECVAFVFVIFLVPNNSYLVSEGTRREVTRSMGPNLVNSFSRSCSVVSKLKRLTNKVQYGSPLA
jgi:hypothetical protein